MSPPRGETIEVGRAYDRIPGAAHVIGAHLVDADDQDIGAVRAC